MPDEFAKHKRDGKIDRPQHLHAVRLFYHERPNPANVTDVKMGNDKTQRLLVANKTSHPCRTSCLRRFTADDTNAPNEY